MKKQEIKITHSAQQKMITKKRFTKVCQLHKIKGGGVDDDCDGTVDE